MQMIILKKYATFIVIATLSLLTLSCSNRYYISPDSLRQQFIDDQPVHTQSVVTNNYGTPEFAYREPVARANVRRIGVVDKMGRNDTVIIGERSAIKIWLTDGKKSGFYLNTIQIISDSAITGSTSHFFRWYVMPIPYNKIAKIQVLPNPL